MAAKPLSHSYSSLKQFDNCPKQYYMQRIAKEVKPSYGEASLYGIRVHEQLEKRLRDGAPLPTETAKYEGLCAGFEALPGKLLAEQEMTITSGLKPTGWWDGDAWMRSKVDILIINGEKATVIDWKTGKHRPDTAQLELFALQTFQHYPGVKRVRSVFIWLKSMESDSITYTMDDAASMWASLLTRTTRIEAALSLNLWPAKPSGLCPWCPAKHLCEFAR